jgi:hypothetical protein
MADNATGHISVNLFIFLFSLYLVTAPGYVYEADVSQLRMAVAGSLIDRFDLSVTPDIGLRGTDGRSYSWFGLAPAIMVVPCYLAGKYSGVPPANYECLVNIVISAATAVLVFLFAVHLGYSPRASSIASFFYGLGTMAWYYAKDPGDHAIETLLILLTAYFGHRSGKENKIKDLLLTALFLGLALLTRPTSMLIVPALICLFFKGKMGADKSNTTSLLAVANQIALFLLAFLPFAGLYLWYNHYRFGYFLENGYGLIAARLGLDYFNKSRFMTGLYGLLLSPGKGFFYYAPVTALFFFSIRPFCRRHPEAGISFLLIILSYLAFYASYIYWHGCSGWGPRFIFVITPFLVIPTASLFDSRLWIKKKLVRVAVYALLIASLMVQTAAVSVNFFKYDLDLRIEHGVKYEVAKGDGAQPIISPPAAVFFDWRRSPIIAQFRSMGKIFAGLHDYHYVNATESITDTDGIRRAPWMNLYDFWWFYKYFSRHNESWCLVVVILLYVAFYYLRKICLLIKD